MAKKIKPETKLVEEYTCPECGAKNSMWPVWEGRKRYYRCIKCNTNYSSGQLDKAWGRTGKKQPSPLSIVSENSQPHKFGYCPKCKRPMRPTADETGTYCGYCDN